MEQAVDAYVYIFSLTFLYELYLDCIKPQVLIFDWQNRVAFRDPCNTLKTVAQQLRCAEVLDGKRYLKNVLQHVGGQG